MIKATRHMTEDWIECIRDKTYDFIVSDATAIWSNPISKILKLPLFISLPTLAYSPDFYGECEDDTTRELIKEFNERYGGDLKAGTDILGTNLDNLMVVYYSKEMQMDPEQYPEDKIAYCGKSFLTDLPQEKENIIFASLGSVFQFNKQFFEELVKLGPKFPEWKFVISCGGNKALLDSLSE
jgi:hypothetical protein